jgi:FkbM family methyltransferase
MKVGFALNLDDNVQRTLFYTGWYDRPFLDLLIRELRPDDVYIDVGAHVGIDAVAAAKQLECLGGGCVIAFEPAPDMAEALRETAERESLSIEVIHAALGNEAGVVELREDSHFPAGDASVRSKFNQGPIACRAPVMKFDEWASAQGLKRADVVKLDIEGAEYEALQGMKGMLNDKRPRLLVVEISEARLHQSGHTERDFDVLLASVGYRRAQEIDENVVYRPSRTQGTG